MKIRITISFLLISISSILWTGCVKEGPVGPQGPSGTNGTNGFDGNANVIASPWYTPSWTGQTGDWYFDVANAAISQDIVEGGVILAYMSVPGDIYANAVRPLPAYALGANWDFLIPDYGAIEFTCDSNLIPGSDKYYFRFILIPASTPLKSGKLKSGEINDLKNKSYQEVCKILGIQE
jgi:hypothetical protein